MTIEGAHKRPVGIQVAKQAVQPASQPSAAPPRKPPQLKSVDREFLPASLEILVTPPSPVARSLLLAICALFVCALAWSYFGWIDIYATAPGKIQPRGGSKVVQPIEAGKVVAIHVDNGGRVNAGDLLAPIDGTVQQLAVDTLGQVVSPGQAVLTVVPPVGSIEIEAMIANQDIGFVQAGEPVVVKIEAFPFTRYGTIDGTVARVSRDAVDQRQATDLSDAASAAKPREAPGGPQGRTQDLVFPATIDIAQRSIQIDGKDFALIPGMAVTVEIKTGRRRAIDYLLSPLREFTRQAARER